MYANTFAYSGVVVLALHSVLLRVSVQMRAHVRRARQHVSRVLRRLKQEFLDSEMVTSLTT